jgi:hypothetical protein
MTVTSGRGLRPLTGQYLCHQDEFRPLVDALKIELLGTAPRPKCEATLTARYLYAKWSKEKFCRSG